MSEKTPTTQGTRFLESQNVPFTEHLYTYMEKGGTANAARQLGIDEHAIVKTLVMQDETQEPVLVLMHGDRQVSTKQLARALGVKSIVPCPPEAAQRHTGYMLGGISPFGTRKPLRVCAERTILDLPRMHINAGHRGFLVGIAPSDMVRVLNPTLVDVAVLPG